MTTKWGGWARLFRANSSEKSSEWEKTRERMLEVASRSAGKTHGASSSTIHCCPLLGWMKKILVIVEFKCFQTSWRFRMSDNWPSRACQQNCKFEAKMFAIKAPFSEKLTSRICVNMRRITIKEFWLTRSFYDSSTGTNIDWRQFQSQQDETFRLLLEFGPESDDSAGYRRKKKKVAAIQDIFSYLLPVAFWISFWEHHDGGKLHSLHWSTMLLCFRDKKWSFDFCVLGSLFLGVHLVCSDF